jgi:hypothetical protein
LHSMFALIDLIDCFRCRIVYPGSLCSLNDRIVLFID